MRVKLLVQLYRAFFIIKKFCGVDILGMFASIIKKWLFPACLILFFLWLFFELFSSRMLFPGKDGWYSGGSTWGDLAYHLSLISSFVWGDNSFFSPQNPIYLGQKLSYYFFFDFLSAILAKLGLSLRWSLIVPALFFSLCLVGLIYFLTLKITRNKVSAAMSPFIFLFNGSIVGIYYFWQDFQKSGFGLFKFLMAMPKQYAHLADFNIHFSNIICDYLLPQRPIILGLTLGVLAIYFLWLYFNNGRKKDLFFAGLIISFLPAVHFHSFLAMVLISAMLAIFLIIKKPRTLLDWLYFGLPIVVFALPQIFWLLPSNSTSFLRWQFGWMASSENIGLFWLKNLGVYILFIILAFIFCERKLKIFYLPFLGLFLISNLIIFQPHDYDNMKLMIFWFLLSSVLMADFLGKIWKKFLVAGPLLALFIFILLIICGTLSVLRESYTRWLMFDREDIALAKFVRENTLPSAIFLTSDKHNHFIPCLSGRKIIMGYRGWLWTHGINYQEREKDIALMFEDSSVAKNLLEKYGVDYVAVGESEKQNFKVDENFYNQNFPILIESGNTKIYKIK